MTNEDRNQFLTKIASLDLEIGDALAARNTLELMALAGKAALLAANALLYQAPPPAPPACLCCDRPATVRAADWDLCEGCYNAVSAPWPGMDESWGELETSDELVY